MTWNTLDVPLETGWQCTLIPAKQYNYMMRRGYEEMWARRLYPNASEDDWPSTWNARPPDEQEKRRRWNDDVRQQLAEDRRTFAGYFRPDLDLRTITGGNALREIQIFVRDFLNLAHWNVPTDNASIKRTLSNAVADGTLIPVVNYEYSGLPRIAQPDPAPQYWPATGGGAGYANKPKVLTGSEFQAIQRANGELPELDSLAGAVIGPLPELAAPARADDDFGPLGIVEAAAGALLGSVDDDPDGSDGSMPLGDAQPFEYSEDTPDGDSFDVAKTPNEGTPGTWYTNPGSGQMRMYGDDGKPVVDFDFDHDHGQGVPHAHNWDNGARGPGVAFSPL